MSAILFNCALDTAFENWKVSLYNESLKVDGSFKRLTNTRYADDILLYAKSLQELQRMAELLIVELRKVGLTLNSDKTKILYSTDTDMDAENDYIDISGEFVRILSCSESHRYLGRYLSVSFNE